MTQEGTSELLSVKNSMNTKRTQGGTAKPCRREIH
jgi:hypothetical protein